MFDSMILCQYDDNLSPVHSLYFIVLSTNMTYHMFDFISPSLRSGFRILTSFQHPILATIPNSIPFHLRKQAVLDVGDLVLRKDSTPSAAGATTPVDATALGSEVFQALQVTASEAWGEGILGPKRVWFFLVGYERRGVSHEKLFQIFFLGGGVKKNGTCMCMCFLFAMIWTLGFELCCNNRRFLMI